MRRPVGFLHGGAEGPPARARLRLRQGSRRRVEGPGRRLAARPIHPRNAPSDRAWTVLHRLRGQRARDSVEGAQERLRRFPASTFLRSLSDCGVTSSSSSSAIQPSAHSIVTGRAVVSTVASSFPAARTLVSFLARQTCTLRSPARRLAPTTWPS